MTTTITANDEPTEIEADVDKRFSSIVVNLPVQQTGTGNPSPSNPRPFTMWTDVSLYVSDTEEADEPTLAIELPTPMYGGKVDMVRGEIATTYNSKESGTGWEMTEEGQFRCQVSAYNNGDETSTDVADLYAVHYETVSNKDAYDATDDLTCGLATIAGTTYLYVNDAQYTTLESFATHIADEVFVFRAHIPMSDVTEPHIVYLPAGTSYVWADAGFVDYTVSGTPPLSLPNSLGKPLKAWEVDVLPKQDLNGYDAPWPAGGGVNKFPVASLDTSEYNYKFKPEDYPEVYDAMAKLKTNQAYRTSSTSTGDNAINSINIYYSDSSHVYITNTYMSGQVADLSDGTITITEVRALCGSHDYVGDRHLTGICLSEGTTAQAYQPYSNICPIYGTDTLTITTAGKNLFDQSQIADATGMSLNAEGYYTGTRGSWNIAFGSGFQKNPLFKANTRYTLSCVGYNGEALSSTTIGFHYTDGTNENLLINTTEPTAFTLTSSSNKTVEYIRGTFGSGVDVVMYIKDIMLVDGTSAEPYEPYNASQTVIDVPPLSANKWDEEWEKGAYNASGEKNNSSECIRCANFIPVKPNTEYYLVSQATNGRVCFYDSNKTFLSRTPSNAPNSVITTPDDCYYVTFYVLVADETYHNDISFNSPSTVTTYNPYNATVYTGTIGSEGGESRSVKVIPNIRNKQSTNQYGISNWAFNFDPPIEVNSLSMSNLLKEQATLISQTTDEGYFLSNATSGYLRLDESRASTVAECNQWIADNDFYLIVTLSAPDQFAVPSVTIPTPTGTATTWATAEDGAVDGMEVTYVGKAT